MKTLVTVVIVIAGWSGIAEADLTLYGVDRNTSTLFSIDVSDASTVAIGNTGVDSIGLAFGLSANLS